jgi:predicted oxidoreductase
MPGWRGSFFGAPEYAALNLALEEIAAARGETPLTIAAAWILRHPAKMQPIIGTTNPDRIAQIAKAADVTITHDEWYELYKSSGKTLP